MTPPGPQVHPEEEAGHGAPHAHRGAQEEVQGGGGRVSRFFIYLCMYFKLKLKYFKIISSKNCFSL
jgi:hypothetical protein